MPDTNEARPRVTSLGPRAVRDSFICSPWAYGFGELAEACLVRDSVLTLVFRNFDSSQLGAKSHLSMRNACNLYLLRSWWPCLVY